jgi:hypothetical protein
VWVCLELFPDRSNELKDFKRVNIATELRMTSKIGLYRPTAISIKVVHEQSGKVEYERERLLGIALKIH